VYFDILLQLLPQFWLNPVIIAKYGYNPAQIPLSRPNSTGFPSNFGSLLSSSKRTRSLRRNTMNTMINKAAVTGAHTNTTRDVEVMGPVGNGRFRMPPLDIDRVASLFAANDARMAELAA